MTKKNKKINLYVVLEKNNDKKFLTLVCDKQDAFEYVSNLLKINHLDHFKKWCSLRELDYKSDEVWYMYINKVLSDEEKQKYIVRGISYKFNDVAGILRMFGGCVPIGCTFDTESEYSYLNYNLNAQKSIEEFQKEINKAKNNLQDTINQMQQKEVDLNGNE